MKHIFRKLSTILMMVTLITCMTMPVFADAFKVDSIQTATTVLFLNCDDIWVASMIETSDQPTIVRNGATIQALEDHNSNDKCTDCGKYHFLAENVKEKDFINRAKEASENSKVKDKLNEMMSDVVIADTNRAMSTLQGLVPVLNLLLGIVVVLITIGLTVVTSLDVAYITFPVFRNNMDEKKASGEGFAVKKTANGGTKLRLVSDEAQYAVQECSVASGKSPLTAYLTKRIWAYILVSIILFILLSGNINIITNIAITIVGYLMQVLSTLG